MTVSLKIRYKNWIDNAHVLSYFDNTRTMTSFVQSLGKLDIKLIKAERKTRKYLQKNPSISSLNAKKWIAVKTKCDETTTLAILWVMGCYEMVRTITSLLKNKLGTENDIYKIAKCVRERYELVRIPLAKHEAPRINKDGFCVASSGFSNKNEMIWRVSKDEIVSRNELSLIFVELLILLANNKDTIFSAK